MLKKKKKAMSRKKKEAAHESTKKEEEEKKKELDELLLCKCTWAFLSIKEPHFSLQFSLHFGEKTFW